MIRMTRPVKFALLLLFSAFFFALPATESTQAQGSTLLEITPINPATDQPAALGPNGVVDLSLTNGQINFEAVSAFGLDLSNEDVRIEVTGPNNFRTVRIERFEPFAAFGDRNGDFFGRSLAPGTYTIDAAVCFNPSCSSRIFAPVTVEVVNGS